MARGLHSLRFNACCLDDSYQVGGTDTRKGILDVQHEKGGPLPSLSLMNSGGVKPPLGGGAAPPLIASFIRDAV